AVPGAAVWRDGPRPRDRGTGVTPSPAVAGEGTVRRVLLAAAGLAFLLAIVSAALLYLRQSSGLVGTDLGGTPAPGFTLTNYTGEQVSLERLRGKPVVLTFLYTHCPDTCPLIADQMRRASELLGSDSDKVAMVAVSTDPRHDDRASVAGFSQVHSLEGRWQYLLGSPEQLAPVWRAYYIGVTPGSEAGSALGDNEVIHSEAVFVIDKAGRERVLLGVPFKAQDLAANLRKLLKEA